MEINTARATVAGIALSLAGFAGYVTYEGWSNTAAPPVKGDVPTYGFGTTKGIDGLPLKGGETITPPQAVALAVRDVEVHQAALKRCLGDLMLAQHEFDALMSLALNVGTSAVCNSSILGHARAGDYAGMCATILDFNKFCSKPKTRNPAGKYVCPPGALKELPGLTKRRQQEYLTCMGVPK